MGAQGEVAEGIVGEESGVEAVEEGGDAEGAGGGGGKGEGLRLHGTEHSRVDGRNNKGPHPARVSLGMRFLRFLHQPARKGLEEKRLMRPGPGATSRESSCQGVAG